MLRKLALETVIILVIFWLSTTVVGAAENSIASNAKPIVITVETEPFIVGKEYLSGEGPCALETFRVSDLITAGKTLIPGSKIDLPSSNQADKSHKVIQGQPIAGSKVKQSKLLPTEQPRLYWITGTTFQVIEKGHVVPEDLLCHAGIEMNQQLHYRMFPFSTHCNTPRIFTFTQGLTQIMLPNGFGIPIATNETLAFRFQAENQVTNIPRYVAFRFKLYLYSDHDLLLPMAALNWRRPRILFPCSNSSVLEEKDSCSSTCCSSSSLQAANDLVAPEIHSASQGKSGTQMTHRWLVPPGEHVYYRKISEPDFASNGPIHAVVSHVHPFCKSVSLIECRPGHPEKALFTINCHTDTNSGIKLTHIDYLASQNGIPLQKTAQYKLKVIYNNSTRSNQIAMAVIIIYFSDIKFRKPLWAAINSYHHPN